MKTSYGLTGCLLLIASLARGTTNDLSATLQRGLFEEEANHDLIAAVSAYQDVVNQFDTDRQMAATAVFRLGECYRKQGHTNEANAQYERILREFGDQTELAKISRTYVGASEPASASSLAPAGGPMSDAQAAASLAEAVEVQRIKAMLKDSPDLINAKDPHDGHTLLQQAAEAGQLEVAKFLLANGADIEAKNPNYSSRTALHFAAAGGHKAMVELLLDKGANVNAGDSEGKTPLHLAVENGYRNLVEVLVARGADVNAKTGTGATPLHVAAANGFKSIAEFLLNHEAEVNAVTTDVRSGTQQVYSGTPLHIAAQRGDSPFAELLLANKADVNAVNNRGETPLYLAAEQGQTAVGALLLSHGASANTRDKQYADRGWTPLVVSVNNNRKPMVDLLLTNGADPNVKFDSSITGNRIEKGDTPLLLAVSKVNHGIVESLLAAKADSNLRSDDGLAPIFMAFRVSDPGQLKRLVGLLLDHGAEVDARDSYERTPLMMATWAGDLATVELLLAHKADPNARDNQGFSALHYLVRSRAGSANAPAIGRALLSAGADVNALDKSGSTPLRALRLPSGPTGPGTSYAIEAQLAQVLREHGGLIDMPLPDRIEVRGPEANYSNYIFAKGTNDWNQFTLLELLAVRYDLLNGNAQGYLRGTDSYDDRTGKHQQPGFPDLTRILIRQPKPNGHEQKVDLNAVFSSGDCSKDVPLKWGEVVEIPEADHPLNQGWTGFSAEQLMNLKKCLSRQVQVIVKGKTSRITLAPESIRTGNYWIEPALIRSGLLLTSSDLSRVKITRTDPATGQRHEWVLDCSEGKPAPDLWLRDGDIIEVPEK